LLGSFGPGCTVADQFLLLCLRTSSAAARCGSVEPGYGDLNRRGSFRLSAPLLPIGCKVAPSERFLIHRAEDYSDVDGLSSGGGDSGGASGGLGGEAFGPLSLECIVLRMRSTTRALSMCL